ncbi:isoaspartyl peptidase/L-asparaginase [soil metagenome]
MGDIAIAIHGGAGADSEFVRRNVNAYKQGLNDAITAGYAFLQKGGSALEAVELVANLLEDNPLFNAGRGACLNNKGEVDMNASIMDGKDLRAGAVAMIRNVKNPITLAKGVMENTRHVFMAGKGAIDFAKRVGSAMRPDAYFITEHRVNDYLELNQQETEEELLQKRTHGTIGCVALDVNGNLAAGTSTGGLTNALEGRIGDSCIIGAGTYANNQTCAVSGTGDGELLIRGVVAHSISSLIEFTGCTLQEACDNTVFERCKDFKGDIGVIAVDPKGNIGLAFNTQRMHRAWVGLDGKVQISVYGDDEA